MKCSNCGAELSPETSNCTNCNNPIRAELPRHATAQSAPKAGRRAKTIVVTVSVLALIGAATGFFVLVGLKGALNSSEANKAAIKLLKQSPDAAGALGEIKEIGWPYGDLQADFATFYMSVTGTKASGSYFASLKKENGAWVVVSGRVQLSDGTSIDIHRSS